MKYALAIVLGLIAVPAFAVINIGIESLVEIVIYLAIVGGIMWLLLWLIGYLALPEPFAKIARIIIVVFGVLILINLLLSFVGHPLVNMR